MATTAKPPRDYTTWLQGLFIVSLGAGFSFFGFRFGLNRQIEKAKTEFDEKKPIDMNKVGPSGVPAKQLAMKAFVKGSAAAAVVAAMGGFAMSYVVEAYHKGVPKEQEEYEMNELYKALGVAQELEDDAKKQQ